MDTTKLRKFCGQFCIYGALAAFVWGIINTYYPNSQGLTATNDFVVLIPWLHRLEHAASAFFIYPALYAGLLGFYLMGGIGRGIIGKTLIGLATIGAILAVLSSAIEVFVLQWETADWMREIGFAFILILISPVLFTVAALIARNIKLWKRFAPFLTLVFLLFFITIRTVLWLDVKYLPLFFGLGFIGWALLGYAVYSENSSSGEEVKLDSLPDADQQSE